MNHSTEDDTTNTLLHPFEGPLVAGEDLRLETSPQSLYFRLRDARAESRAAERTADNDPEIVAGLPPQWATVVELAEEALATRSKDIEIACWLTEGLARRQGLAGFAGGVGVVSGLIEGFWSEGLFPTAEEDDPEGRLAALTGLSGQDRDGSLLQPLRKTVLFTRGDGMPVTLWDYERSAEIATQGGKPEKSKSKALASVIPFPDVEAEARSIGLESLRVLHGEIGTAAAGWRRLEDAITRIVPPDAQPSTSRVRALLETLRQTAARYLPADMLQAAETAAPSDAETPVDGEAAPPVSVLHSTLPQGREALLDEVLRIASAFRRNEPNSPISFTLEEAVRRARMPWPDLLRELVADQGARASMMTIAGLRADGLAATDT